MWDWSVAICSEFPVVFHSNKYSHVTSILKSLHWLKVKERIVYKTVSLTYKSIITPGQSYMSHLIEVKQPTTTLSSKLITLERPSIPSRCKLSNRSFRHAAPQIWNSLPSTFRTPSFSLHQTLLSSEQFHRQLKTYLFDLFLYSEALGQSCSWKELHTATGITFGCQKELDFLPFQRRKAVTGFTLSH